MSTLQRGHRAALAVLMLVIAVLAGACGSEPSDVARDGPVAGDGVVGKRPNIVFVLMDDFSLDLLRTMRSARYMDKRGAAYDNAFVVESLCCPSRAATLTGQYPHQNGVRSNAEGRGRLGDDAAGGWKAFVEKGSEARTFAVGLQDSGYTTGFVGKYLNQYPLALGEGVPPIPQGWSDFRAVSNEAYDGWDFTSTQPTRDGGYETRHWPAPPRSAPEPVRDQSYAGTVIEDLALDFIRQHRDDDAPYFLEVAPYAPHSAITQEPPYADEPIFPAAFRDRAGPGSPHGNCGLVDCHDLTIADLPGFGEPIENRPFVRSGDARRDFKGKELTAGRAVEDLRNRAQMVQSVDRMVMRILRSVDENTYVALTSDNGFHLGQHGLMRGKGTPYDTDTHIPSLVVGPDVVPGHRDTMTSNIDWAPTFEDIAGVTTPRFRSGTSLVPTFADPGAASQDYVFIEHSHLRTKPGSDPDRAYSGGGLNAIPSYVAVRSRHGLLVRNDLDRRPGHAEWAYEFYDYSAQRYERVNEFDNVAYASQIATLLDKLADFDACREFRYGAVLPSRCRTITWE